MTFLEDIKSVPTTIWIVFAVILIIVMYVVGSGVALAYLTGKTKKERMLVAKVPNPVPMPYDQMIYTAGATQRSDSILTGTNEGRSPFQGCPARGCYSNA